MSMHAHRDPSIPRGALIFAAALIAGTIATAAAVRTGLAPLQASPVAIRSAEHLKPVQVRDLVFADQPDGGVRITDVTTGQPAEVIAPLSHSGFIRGVMRGLARERRMHGIGSAPPFRLTAWPDGGLSLTDTATGRIIELGAFGSTNRAAFAALLKVPA